MRQISNYNWAIFHASIRQEAAGALWNLSFDDRNRESIASAGGVQALVWLYILCIYCEFVILLPIHTRDASHIEGAELKENLDLIFT